MKVSTNYQRRLTKSLNFRLVFFVCVFLLVAKGLFSCMMTRMEHDELITEVVNGSRRFSEGIKRSTRYAMLKFDREAMHHIFQTVGRQENVERVRILNKEGDVIISTHAEEIGHKVNKHEEACYGCHDVDKPFEHLSMSRRWRIFGQPGDRRVGIVDPIYNEPDCWNAQCHQHPEDKKVLGVLDVIVSLKEVDEMLARSTWRRMIFTLVAIIIVGAVISYYLYRTVTVPVRRLVAGTKRIANGELDYQIAVAESTEIGYLAQSFNNMARNLKEQQKQLVHTAKLASLGTLAAGIAHEINNPLGVASMYAQMAQSDAKKNPSRQQQRMETVVAEISRAGQIVRNLLEFARQTEPKIAETDLNDAIEKTLSIIQHQAELQNIKIVRRLQLELPVVHADADKLRQVFVNIAINAFQAMPDGGELTFTSGSSSDGKAVKVEIADTGHGISEEHITNLFDPFFTTKEIGKGTGLGLSVSHGIIKQHGGSIDVESSVGKGTTFTILLPIKPPRE